MSLSTEDTINPRALKAARKRLGLTQQGLAEAICRHRDKSISAKSICRYEKGDAKPSRKKVQWLAEALHTTPEKLCRDPQGSKTSPLDNLGQVQIRPWLRHHVLWNYRVIDHLYGGVSITALIDAAPWMFALLAEMSLTDRKQRLADADTAFEAAKARLPKHLGHDFYAESDFIDEKDSIEKRDIFGKTILLEADRQSFDPPFDAATTNPFVEFLRRKASEINSVEIIDPDRCELAFGSDLPTWGVFEALDEIAGGWATEQAIAKGHVRLDAIPPELLGAEKRTEREAWVMDHIPDDARARLVEIRDALSNLFEEA